MTFIPKVERNTTHGEIVQLRAPEVPNFAFFKMSYFHLHTQPQNHHPRLPAYFSITIPV